MTEKELIELCHGVMREDPAAVLLVRGYPTGLLQLVDKAVKIKPDVDRDKLREALYMLLVPGMWGADQVGRMMKENPNVTGKEIAEVLRKADPGECEHGRTLDCIACEELPGLDVSETSIQTVLDDVKALRSFAKVVADSFDCDSDAHKYGTFCRACEAKKILEKTD